MTTLALRAGVGHLPLLFKEGCRRQPAGWLTVLALLLPLVAHAALFDDEEARRQINQIRAQIESNQKAIDARLSQMESAGQNRAVDMAQMVDALRQDIARLRGQIEVLMNQTDVLERRQKDLYVDLDSRLRKLEQAQSQLQDKLTQGERDAAAEKQAYESALNQFKVGNYQLAITGFQAFMAAYTNSQLLPSAQYWIGNAYYAMHDFKSAIAAQQKVVGSWPDNPKAADAMLNIASSQSELGQSAAARDTLRSLVKKYPSSPAAEQAKQRLARK